MKIAVIGVKGLPAKQGGIENYCAEVYPRMVAQGHSVDLFARASYTDSAWLDNYDFEGVQVCSLPSLPLRGIDAFISSALGAIASSTTKYDIVHFHALGPALFSWLPKLASSAKVVVTCQGLDWQRAKWGNTSSSLILMGEKAAVRHADEIIVVSKNLQSYFFETYGRQTVYIPNAPASYAESDHNFSYGTSLGLNQGKYILFLGRLVPEKRPDLLIEAFQVLKPAGWKLVLAGGVSDTNLFTSKLSDLADGNPDIIFAGEIRGTRLAELVRGAGLFVLPSDLEGLPLSMLEAMSQGIPVLASDIPPHQQLINDQRGHLFRAGDINSCIQGLDWAIAHPQEMAVMAKKAQQHVEKYYNWDHITAENLRIYTTGSKVLEPVSVADKSLTPPH
ncbi:MAG: glycosyltransferase family 4 protein [Coleofasciculaceae cyanobacterium]